MILSNILKGKSFRIRTLLLAKLNIKLLQTKLEYLSKSKSTFQALKEIRGNTAHQKLIRNSFICSKLEKRSFVEYVVDINLSPTNTLINITDAGGNPKRVFSAGSVGLTKQQKKQQPNAIIRIFKMLLLKSTFLKDKPVAIHLRNVKTFHKTLILKILKSRLFIKSVQTFNLLPHNGCRPKKIRRVKRRTRRIVLR